MAKYAQILAICLAVVLVSGDAGGHTLPRERTMMVEVKEEALEALVVFQEPPGKRLDLLFAQHDLDGDGKLTGAEADNAAGTWVPYVLQGLEFDVTGEELEREPPEIKFKEKHHGSLTTAIYLTWPLPELDTGPRRVTVSRDDDAAPFATILRFQTQPPLAFQEAPGPAPGGDYGARVGPYNLAPGKTIGVTVERDPEVWTWDDLPTANP